MIKRLIFDIDNTLLKWDDKYYDYSLGNAFKELGLNFDRSIIKPFDKVVDTYEDYYDIYDKDKFLIFLNDKLNLNLPAKFIDLWLKYLGDCYEKPSKELIDTLEYLKSKYDLVILSNWFTISQEKRIKNMGIDKYFSKQIYTDILKNKPNKEAFMEAIKPYNIDECIMIGDSKEKDIKGAESIGMKAILIDDKTKVEDLRRILWNFMMN